MSNREIWTQWIVHRKSTAEIARQFKLAECDVDRVIERCMSANYYGTEMPFGKGAA